MDIDLEKIWREGRERWEKMTTREIAIELGTTVGALYRWARLGRVPGMTEEFLDQRRKMDPLREVDRADFEPGSCLIDYEYSWNKQLVRKLRRFETLDDVIELAFLRGRQGRFENYVSIRVRDRLAFFVDTTPIAFLDCQRTWFIVEFEDGDEDGELLVDDVDTVADYIESYHEEPFRIRPSLYFRNVEAAQDGLMNRTEFDPAVAESALEARVTFEHMKDLAQEPWEWPGDADWLILGVLRDRQAMLEDRMLAAELAGNVVVINDELVDGLLAIVGNASEPVLLRAQAASSFGPALEASGAKEGFDGPGSGPPLTRETYHALREALGGLYRDATVPGEVRRRVLEAAVRSPQAWHDAAIREAWSAGEQDWMLTATFCMRFIKGFEGPILDALNSDCPEIRYEAVCAAGNWRLDAGWEQIAPLISPETQDKKLLIAAIEAATSIRPSEVPALLEGLYETEDEDILEAVEEALAFAEAQVEF